VEVAGAPGSVHPSTEHSRCRFRLASAANAAFSEEVLRAYSSKHGRASQASHHLRKGSSGEGKHRVRTFAVRCAENLSVLWRPVVHAESAAPSDLAAPAATRVGMQVTQNPRFARNSRSPAFTCLGAPAHTRPAAGWALPGAGASRPAQRPPSRPEDARARACS